MTYRYYSREFGSLLNQLRTQDQDTHLSAGCHCGQVQLRAAGRPILTGTCYCKSCQEAGGRFEELPGAASVLDHAGGTDYVMVRKDRVQCVKGQEHLQEYRLKPESPTRRVVATCCNSPLFLDFTKGHWLTIYRNRFPAGAPPVELRMMTKERRVGTQLSDDVPNYPALSGKFMLKLLAAWAAMGFRRPEITWGRAPGAR